MASKKNEGDQYNFLNDRPTSRDEIGTHSLVADSLLKIIHSKLKRPFVVGLFGAWGVGKSSIVEMLQERTKEEGAGTKVVVIDAWRKDKETFLRQFIKKLARELLSEDQAKKVAEEADIRKVKHISSWIPGRFAQVCFCIFVVTVVLLGVLLIKLWLANPDTKFPAGEIALMLLTILLAIYFQYILPKYSVHTGDEMEDISLHDVAHFRKIYFQKIIDKCRPKTVCIVVDNLDRVGEDDAVAIMRAIKTFLVDVEEIGPDEESKDAVPHEMLNKVVFIIPCDDGALRKHIIKRDSQESGNEFLRKFFNISLRIPNFNERDCYRYACNLLNKTNLELGEKAKDRIAHIITSLFGNNPRQPKIFINNFLARYIVGESFETNNKLAKGIVTEHQEWFAVYVALDSEFSDLQMPKTTGELRDLLIRNDPVGYVPNVKRMPSRIDIRTDFLQKIDSILRQITPEAWVAYYYLKKANDALLIEGFEELKESALKGTDDFVDKLEPIRAKHPNVLQSLWNVSLGGETRVKIMQSILKAKAKISKIPLDGRVPEEMARLIRDKIKDLPMLMADVVYQEILRAQEEILYSILYDIVATDNSGSKAELYRDGGPKEFQVELVREMLRGDEDFSDRIKERLDKAVNFLAGRSDKLTIPAIKNGKYPSDNIMGKGITLFRQGNEELCPLDLVVFCGSFDGNKCVDYLKQIIDVLNQNLKENKYNTEELCEAAIRVNTIMMRKNREGLNVAQVNVVNTISALDTRYEEDNNWKGRYAILKTVKEYSKLDQFPQWKNTAKSMLISRGNHFLKSGEDIIVTEFLENEKEMVIDDFTGILQVTAGRSERLCHVVLDCYPESSQPVITGVFPSQPGWVVSWVESRGFRLDEKARRNIQSGLMEVAPQANYRIEIYKALSFLDISESDNLKKSRENHFSALITSRQPLTISEKLTFVLERILAAEYLVNDDQKNKLEEAFRKIDQDIVSSELKKLIKNYNNLKKKKK